ncbi:hypothetical protein AB0I35_13940 [Nocardia sp. NPDC050378]|uniref:hypothetical protein n=1 Tax=Nocardia sp. NPDC050378 TaxID=3155400 RepID=UPI003408F7EC
MNYPPAPPPPPPGANPPGQGGQVAAMAAAGALSFIGVNAMAGFVVLMLAASTADATAARVLFGLAALVSAGAAFGGGWALIRLRKPVWKGFGLGLMIGWALTTVCTAGFCTAVNPYLYTDTFGMAR